MGQRIKNTQQFNRSDYLDRSCAHRNTGWILLGGGALAVVGGFAIFANNFDLWNDSNDNVEVGSIIMVGVGGVAMAGSIFFFSSTIVNRRHANDLSANIKLESIPNTKSPLQYRPMPAIGIAWKWMP